VFVLNANPSPGFFLRTYSRILTSSMFFAKVDALHGGNVITRSILPWDNLTGK